MQPNEKISFLATRAPSAVWRHLKSISYAGDGTATRMCTEGMLEFLTLRRWTRDPWLRPDDFARWEGPAQCRPISVPLSNVDRAGDVIVSPVYLKERGLLDLFDHDRPRFRQALEAREFGPLVRLAASNLQVSEETFACTFVGWLAATKCPEADACWRPANHRHG